jgi:hypothetical protein
MLAFVLTVPVVLIPFHRKPERESCSRARHFCRNSFGEVYLNNLTRGDDSAHRDYARLRRHRRRIVLCALHFLFCGTQVFSQSPPDNPLDLAKYAMRLPESSLVKIEPKNASKQVNCKLQISDRSGQAVSAISEQNSRGTGSGDYTWKVEIATTIFWIGEKAPANNPISNNQSAWDASWISSYGGIDTPISEERSNFAPSSFIPRQNPFYVALPYNDVEDHHTKPEAARVVPWYHSSFSRDGQSVCKGRWVEIRHGNKVCYAQWEDVNAAVTRNPTGIPRALIIRGGVVGACFFAYPKNGRRNCNFPGVIA